MNERIKQLRKKLGLTLEKFGERVGVGKAALSRIENGSNGVTEQMFKSICREFNVDEEWLRTGAGGPDVQFKKQETFNPNDEISSFFYSIQQENSNSFKKKLIKMLSSLDEAGWNTLENTFKICNQIKEV